jgi:uncharacterized protein involved in response to NO
VKTIPLRVAVPAPGMPGARGGASWQAAQLWASPHRLGFMAGSLMLVVSSLWWWGVQTGRVWPAAVLPWAHSPSLAHAVLMTFSFMPLFFTGFLFTAGPKWLGLPPVRARRLLPSLLPMLAGWGVYLIGVHQLAPLAGLGLAAVAWGWTAFTGRFWRLVRASDLPDRLHAQVVAVASTAGAAALWLAAAGHVAGHEAAVRVALAIGLWWFIAPVYAAVLHRMIPFFTASAMPGLDAWRPMWLMWTWVACLVLQVPLGWPGVPPVLKTGVDVFAAVLLLWLAVRWGLVQSLKVRLLAMLHIGFAWLGVGFALQAAGWTLAGLHAITMGFLGSTLLAMVTRVSCGHGGRTLAADNFAWAAFLGLQAAVLLRIAGALLETSPWPIWLAATLWMAVMLAWGIRHMGWYGRPRADGRPG